VLTRVNEWLLEAHQDELFVTLLYGVLDCRNNSFCFANAGHVPPLVRYHQTGKVDVIERGTGLPIGVVAAATFEEQEIILEQEDVVFFVTDGVTEAMNPERAMFGIDGLSKAMLISHPPTTNVVGDVLSELRAFVDGETQYDDITIVAIGADSSLEDTASTLPPDYLGQGVIRKDS
jgi:sigma-B regulation protein RsbU (phosphoserine phosphatase)